MNAEATTITWHADDRRSICLLVLDVLRTILQAPHMSATANFFDNGGDSLLAAELAQRVAERGGYRIDIADVFDGQSALGIASILCDRMGR